MTHRSWRILAVFIAFIPGSPDHALACSCGMSGPPCQATWTADAVFSGIVQSVEMINHEDLGGPSQQRLVRFTIEQPFVNAGAGPIEIVTGMGGGDCGYAFTRGRRYLVYAWKRGTRMYTGICSRTKPLAEAEEDLRYLTSMPQAGVGGKVYGRINEWQRDPAEELAVDHGPVEGLVVSLRGPAFAREVVTDKHGSYEFSGLPAGRMTLTVIPPSGFSTRYLEHDIELKDLRSCSQHDFQIHHEARVSGTVVDGTGRPLAGVRVEAIAAELAGHDPKRLQQPVKTDERGWFQMDELPPGSYVFGVNLTKGWGEQVGRAVYFPGTANPSEATILELKPGDRKEIGALRLTDR